LRQSSLTLACTSCYLEYIFFYVLDSKIILYTRCVSKLTILIGFQEIEKINFYKIKAHFEVVFEERIMISLAFLFEEKFLLRTYSF
jgi:hypothetical protein